MNKNFFSSLSPIGATVSHLKNFAMSASRGSMAVFIFGVVAALVGAMMLLAPAGYAQEESEAEVIETSLDQEEPAQASEAEDEPVLYQDPIDVERDGDIDTVTVDDLDFGAWRDSFSGEEKVSDDALYGISRKSDAGIDEIVEVEADNTIVDEDAYGFVHDDEADLDKIVIDYYGLKTTPPETLTLKIKSSEEGEYSILDADDIPAKADVQDAGFLPDPSAEEQEAIDKVKKENRAADSDTHLEREGVQPQGPGKLDAELKRSDSSFNLITGDADDSMKATSYAESRGELRDGVSTYEDIVTIEKRSKFEGATVTVKADPKFLFPGFAENYAFETFYAGGQPDGKTGIEEGYKFYVKDYNVDRYAGVVTYTVGVENEKGKPVDSALIEGGTQLSVKSKFASTPDAVQTTVELVGQEIAKAADKTWSNGEGAVLPKHPPYIPGNNFWRGGTQSDIYKGSNIGPFNIETSPNFRDIVMWGGMCLNPKLDPPGRYWDRNLTSWEILPSDRNPVYPDRSISLQKQQAISFIVNSVASRKSQIDGAEKFDEFGEAKIKAFNRAGIAQFEENAISTAEQIWPDRHWDKVSAFEALYTTVLKLFGYKDSEINAAATSILDIADKGVENVLALDKVGNAPVNYYIVKPIGSNDIQPVIIPGPEDGEDQRSSMATTASFEENRFDSDRLNTAVLGERSKVYDKVEFLGLNTDGSYKLHTELYAVDENGETVGEPVHTETTELSQEEIKSGEKTVEVDLNNMSSRKKAQPGRYVFFEKITDSNDGDREIVKHANSKDAAQTFELTKSKKPNGAKLTITKVAADGDDGKDYTPVEGAKFEIRQNGKKIADMAGNGSEFTADGLELDKIYTLVEVQAPDRQDGKNYQLLPEPLDFKFDSKEGLQFKTERGTFDSTQSFPVVEIDSNVDAGVVIGTATVANVWIGDLPKTGGNGIAPWLLLGGVIMAAGALLANRRRA